MRVSSQENDGLPVMLYKKFWPLVKKELLLILNGFALGTVDIARLNFRILSMTPKVLGAVNIKQFCPIALINVIFKLVSKAYAMRLSPDRWVALRSGIALTKSRISSGKELGFPQVLTLP
jgi:hypothetical protein